MLPALNMQEKLHYVIFIDSLLLHNVALLSHPERKAQRALLTTGDLKPDHISLCSEKF